MAKKNDREDLAKDPANEAVSLFVHMANRKGLDLESMSDDELLEAYIAVAETLPKSDKWKPKTKAELQKVLRVAGQAIDECKARQKGRSDGKEEVGLHDSLAG